MSKAEQKPESKPTGYRSGVAARLAGLPVETLRVWERRYGVSDVDRSPHGQRLYSADQVRRLGLLKRVVDQGHAIGTVARLAADELIALAGAAPSPAGPGAITQTLKIAVAGAALARRLGAIRTSPELDIVASCFQLEGAAEAMAGVSADVLLIESSEMSADALPQIQAARRAMQVRTVVVLYRFCDSATVRRLREHGCLVARAPSDAAEVAVLCSTALSGAARPPPGPSTAPPPRRLDDQALAALSSASSSINCECPRHLADILMMLASFERYSYQCQNRNASDAALHEDLGRSAGHARVMMEQALERLAYAEGLPLPDKQ
nr:MerR family transcriptional regulator [uncultured Duganella sp.]